MKERPILFNAEMVRAILDGRKTQTRRPLRVNMVDNLDLSGAVPELREKYQFLRTRNGGEVGPVTNPFGQPGTRLWVRETWAHDAPSLEECRARLEDGLAGGLPYGPYYRTNPVHEGTGLRWRPSIHMPRWASRIILEITDVRVERLQDITEDDAMAEGVNLDCPVGNIAAYTAAPYPYCYAQLWDSMYSGGNHAWDANPWVWVVEFKRVQS